MNAHIKLGRIFGIQVGLHYSWLIIALLVTVSLNSHFGATNPQWGVGVIWATAVVTGLLFFVAILLHELSHAAVAKARGLPVRSITLFALGGAGFGGVWLAFIGWFLVNAAGSAYAQVETNENLRGVKVGDVMARDCPAVDGHDNLQTFVD
jgi:hypothetical protein